MTTIKELLTEQMACDLVRFNETCEDGQEYDVPKDRMRAMANFGLVRWCGGSRFEITDCGIAALEAISAPAAPVAQEPVAFLTEDGDRVVTAKTYNSAKKDGGATWSSMKPFTVAAYTAPPAADQPNIVKVRRELLDSAATWLEVHAPSGGSVEGDVAQDLRALLGKEGEA